MSNFTYRRLSRIILIVVLSSVIGISALTGTVAAAEDFQIEINYVNPDQNINASEDLIVNVTIENTGSSVGSQNITLRDSEDENTLNETSTGNIAPGNKKSKNITWENVPKKETIEPIVKTENATAQPLPVTVLWSEYNIEDVAVNRTDLSSGENLEFYATIENEGTDAFPEKIYLNSSTKQEDNKTIEITEGTSSTRTFDVITAPNSPGEYTYTAETKDDSGTQDITVSGNFTVEDLDGRMDGQNLTIEA